ncbi:phosphopyruvate hydratase [Candidatus Uhrbacteria bacterium]|nr:phosphopyruvate hydratase [Candidatus Uhrbacteria bacterium]
MKIRSIIAREILDSRGNPTVEARVVLKNGVVGVGAVPSGASTGTHEALELRDGDRHRYGGKGVLKAVRNVNGPIAKLLRGRDVREQRKLDAAMIELDGTKNKSSLGANAILAVSLASARAAAAASKLPLYQYIRKAYRFALTAYNLPVPMMNILNGGVHADSGLAIQEFMIVPHHRLFRERVRIGSEVFHALKRLLREKGFQTQVGDEGGFAPKLGDNEKAFAVIVEAIKKAGYKPGDEVSLASDFAASEFYDRKKKAYHLVGPRTGWTGDRMTRQIDRWVHKYPIVSLEDPFAEDDWEHWAMITKLAKLRWKRPLIVGDDLFVTNIKRLERGIKEGVGSAILVKLNQIGTLSETIDCVQLAQKNKYKVIISHRSGETADTFIADLAVAVGAEYIKTGSLSRSERVEKYNRLMEIEREIG